MVHGKYQTELQAQHRYFAGEVVSLLARWRKHHESWNFHRRWGMARESCQLILVSTGAKSRRPGRPRHTWLRTVLEDLRQFNLGLASGLRRAQNRTARRTLTGTATSPTSSDWWWWCKIHIMERGLLRVVGWYCLLNSLTFCNCYC